MRVTNLFQRCGQVVLLLLFAASSWADPDDARLWRKNLKADNVAPAFRYLFTFDVNGRMKGVHVLRGEKR